MKKVHFSLNTVFSRLLFFNLLLVILVTAIPQVFFLNYFKRYYEGEINRNNMQMVNQVQRSVDELVLEKMINIPNIYLSEVPSNSTLTYPFYHDISKEPTMLTDIVNRIQGISNTLKFNSTITIYYTNGNVLFNNYGVNLLEGAKSGQRIMEFVDGLKNTDFNVLWLSGGILDEQTAGYVTYVRSIPYFASKENRKGMIAVTIEEKTLYSYISDLKFNEGGKFFIINEKGEVISHSERNMLSRKILEDGNYVNRVLREPQDGLFEDQVEGKLSVVAYSKSAYNNWIYVSVSSIDSFYKKSHQMNNFLLVICLLFLAINIAASVFMTKRAHQPLDIIIKSLSSLSRAIYGEKENLAGNEYKLLDNTVKGLSYKIGELNSQLEVNKPIIRHNAISKLLKGAIVETGNISTNEELMDSQFRYNGVCSFILKIFGSKSLGFENEMMVGYNIIKLMEKQREDFEVMAIIDENRQISGIVNYQEDTELEKIIAVLTSDIESLLNTSYVLCFGSACRLDIYSISRSYYQACEVLKYAYIKPDHKVLHYRDIKTESLKLTGSSPRLLERIAESLRAYDEARLKFSIEAIVASLLSGEYTIEYCKNTLSDVVSTVRTTLTDLGYDDNEILGYDIREYFKTIENIHAFTTWIYGVIDIILMRMNEKRQQISGDLGEKILKAINENLYKDISLETLADALFISPGYLSKVFKVVMGKNFNEYITDVKLEQAVKLLTENKLTVKDTADRLGYSYTHYFIRIFKEKYGQTPKEYQKSNAKLL